QVGSDFILATVGGVLEPCAKHCALNGAVFGDVVRLCIGYAEELGVPIPRHVNLMVDHHLLEANAQQEHATDQRGGQNHTEDGHRRSPLIQAQILQGIQRQDIHARTASSRRMRPSLKVMMRSACSAMSRSCVTKISVCW